MMLNNHDDDLNMPSPTTTRTHATSLSSDRKIPWCLILVDLLVIISTGFLVNQQLHDAGGSRIWDDKFSLVATCTFFGLVILLLATFGSFIVGLYIIKKGSNNDNNESVADNLPEEEEDNISRTENENRDDAVCRDPSDETMTTPLLQDIEEEIIVEPDNNSEGPSSNINNEETTALDLETAKVQAQIDHTLSTWREGIFLSAYIIVVVLSFVLGIEAVDLGGKDDDGSTRHRTTTTIHDVVYIACALSSLQIIYFLSKYIITSIQSSSATLLDLRAVHVHPLRFDVSRYEEAYCDICSASIKDGQCFRCTLCDFDFCVTCYKKGRKVQDWAVLRGDRGIKVSPGAARRAGMGTYFLRSLGLLWTHFHLVIATSVFLLFNVVCQLFVPNVEGALFDDLIENNTSSFLWRVKFLAVYFAGRSIFVSLQRYAARLISRRLRLDLRKKLFDRLLEQDIAFFDSTRAGAMSRRIDGDVEDMSRPIPILVNNVLQSLVLIVGSLTCCLVSSFRLTVLSGACLGPTIYLTYVSAEWGGNLEGQMVACEEEGSATITEALTNIRTIRALSAEPIESKKYSRILSRLMGKMYREALGDMILEVVEGILEHAIELLVLGFGGLAILQGHVDALSIGQLIAFTMYWDIFTEGLESINGVFSELAQAAGAAQRVFDLMDVNADIPLNEGHIVDRQTFRGAIRFDNVRFAYQTRMEKNVLDGFNLEIPAGGCCALVGRSGAGKSTLAHLIMRFYDPRSGMITVDDKPLVDLNLKSFHDLIGFVPQDTKLSFGTVRDNLKYGLPWEPDDREIEEAARAANCADFIEELEDGYDTNLGEDGVRLSGGQRQRLAIARAFLRRPRLLILDEATSHLDAENEQQVQEAIDRLIASASSMSTHDPSIESREREGCTVIVIAHRLSTVRNADVIAVINEGEVSEHGSHDALMERGGIYAGLVAVQTECAADSLPENDATPKPSSDVMDMDNLFDTVVGKREPSLSGYGSGSESASSSASSSSDDADY